VLRVEKRRLSGVHSGNPDFLIRGIADQVYGGVPPLVIHDSGYGESIVVSFRMTSHKLPV
jgi:hypothetical protein